MPITLGDAVVYIRGDKSPLAGEAELVDADTNLRGTGSRCVGCSRLVSKPPRVDTTKQGAIIGFFIPDQLDIILDSAESAEEQFQSDFTLMTAMLGRFLSELLETLDGVEE